MDDRDSILEAADLKAREASAPRGTRSALRRALADLLGERPGWIPEESLAEVGPLAEAGDLPSPASLPLEQLAVIRLNGGLGTSMGLDGPKSLVPVRDSWNFLDFIARQILHLRQGGHAPRFYLMNSYRTRRESLAHLRSYPGLPDPGGRLDFLQGRIPRIDCGSLLPVRWERDPELEWCPPGHGDIYCSLEASGLLESLIGQDVRYLFVANSDNLGATVDPALFAHFVRSGAGFMMEVARRTPSDRKGGHLARRRRDGRLVLRERAQCPPGDLDFFQDHRLHQWFNTNNLWIRTGALSSLLGSGSLLLPSIRNRKRIDPAVPGSPEVWQLETAMGAAIECFPGSQAVAVPRSRFSPVKTTSDLLVAGSDACVMGAGHELGLAPSRKGIPPLVDLDPAFFGRLADFRSRFPRGYPSLIGCRSLEARGDISFEGGVTCRGRVSFSSGGGASRRVPAGVYEDQELVLGE